MLVEVFRRKELDLVLVLQAIKTHEVAATKKRVSLHTQAEETTSPSIPYS